MKWSGLRPLRGSYGKAVRLPGAGHCLGVSAHWVTRWALCSGWGALPWSPVLPWSCSRLLWSPMPAVNPSCPHCDCICRQTGHGARYPTLRFPMMPPGSVELPFSCQSGMGLWALFSKDSTSLVTLPCPWQCEPATHGHITPSDGCCDICVCLGTTSTSPEACRSDRVMGGCGPAV